jgi:hypothetical protein
VRTQGNPADALATIRNAVESLDKNLPLYDVKNDAATSGHRAVARARGGSA